MPLLLFYLLTLVDYKTKTKHCKIWEQEKPQARKMPENAQNPIRQVHAVLVTFISKIYQT